jgi:hypothetical protein
MKKTLAAAALIAGFLAGASAISALAQTGGTWSVPTLPPPNGNTDAPLNAGISAQQKNGWLGVIGLITTNLQIASGTPGVGQVLMSDATGGASWQAGATITPGDTCTLLATTPKTTGASPWVQVAVPDICQNGLCTLFLAEFAGDSNDPSVGIRKVRSVSLMELSDYKAKTSKGTVSHWWAKSGGTADGTDCTVGKNGTLDSCDQFIATGDDIGIFDDDSRSEVSTTLWSVYDNNNNYSTKTWYCK